jgi:hypothetical protein
MRCIVISQYLFPGILAGACILTVLSIVVMWLGVTIENTPVTGERKSESFSRPEPFTKIFSFACGMGYVTSAAISTSDDKVIAIIGIVGMIAMIMFVATAFVFSTIVLNNLKSIVKNHDRGCATK